MTISKSSLNFFANQYNIAVSTRAMYFRVENTQINRDILDLLYKEGLILNYSFNFEDVYLSEDNIKNKKDKVLPFTRKIQRTVDPKLYFFNLLSLTTVIRDKLPTRVINDKDQIPSDLYMKTNLYDVERKEEDLILFIYKILDLYFLLKSRMEYATIVQVCNRFYSFWYETVSSVCIQENTSIQDMFNSILTLKELHENEEMHHVPVRFLFSPEFEKIFLDYIHYMFTTDPSFREAPIWTRAEMQLELSQDSWKYQDTVFEDDRIFVFPKYYMGTPVVKKITTCGGTVVWKYSSYEEMNLLKQEKGFTTLFLLSTTKGLILDSMNSLLIKEGGLMLLSLKI